MKGKAEVHVNTRPRCPHDGKLLNGNNRCWMCGKTPQEWGNSMVQVVESNPKVDIDIDTGEITGQLMFGISVPRVDIQRKAELVLDERQFNAHTWRFGPGDKLTVTERDGMLVVKMTTKGEE